MTDIDAMVGALTNQREAALQDGRLMDAQILDRELQIYVAAQWLQDRLERGADV